LQAARIDDLDSHRISATPHQILFVNWAGL
jgi:hypothetical protein